MIRGSFYILMSVLVLSCSKTYQPKPHAYNRIDLKEPVYKALPDTFPYWFEFSEQAKLLKDSTWISERFWIDLHYPEFEADVQISYKPVKHNPELALEYMADAWKLTSQHQVKAYAINETFYTTDKGRRVAVAELEGEVPSQLQFFSTDSSEHFIRGALYFRTATENDSLAPIINYIKHDIVHMLNTLEWRQVK